MEKLKADKAWHDARRIVFCRKGETMEDATGSQDLKAEASPEIGLDQAKLEEATKENMAGRDLGPS